MFAGARRYCQRLIAAEVSTVTRYCDRVLQYLPLPHDDGCLFAQVAARQRQQVTAAADFPDLSQQGNERTAVLLNGNVNHCDDVQGLLTALKPRLNRRARVILVGFNPYLQWLFAVLSRLGLRRAVELPRSFPRRVDLEAICRLTGYELVRLRPVAYSPWLLGFGGVLNRLLPLVPGVRWLSLASVTVLRPIIPEPGRPALSVVVPARNEAGNIAALLQRLPDLPGVRVELIFVEGHSTDNTWQEIQRLLPEFGKRFTTRALQQTGEGKNDAVRLGFAEARGDLLAVLDADLTVPPELLGRFYEAYAAGHADFINGNRLVYAMEPRAMRYLNFLGNIFFAKLLSWVLDQPYGDVLCGTKLLSRADYSWFTAWRHDFGDFDPFGDFELLFPAAQLGLGSLDLPVRYGARTYGTTNIRRFLDGAKLLWMCVIGLFRVKLGRTRCA